MNTELLVNTFTQAPLQARFDVRLKASAEAVFNVVANHAKMCDIVPGMERITVRAAVDGEPSGVGTVRYCDFGNDMVIAEQIVLWQPPLAYGYKIAVPNPFGLWHHFSRVDCYPEEQHTHLTWRQFFDHDDLPAMLALISGSLLGVFENLIGRFGGETLT